MGGPRRGNGADDPARLPHPAGLGASEGLPPPSPPSLCSLLLRPGPTPTTTAHLVRIRGQPCLPARQTHMCECSGFPGAFVGPDGDGGLPAAAAAALLMGAHLGCKTLPFICWGGRNREPPSSCQPAPSPGSCPETAGDSGAEPCGVDCASAPEATWVQTFPLGWAPSPPYPGPLCTRQSRGSHVPSQAGAETPAVAWTQDSP